MSRDPLGPRKERLMTYRNENDTTRLGSRSGSASILVLLVSLAGFLMAATTLAIVVGGSVEVPGVGDKSEFEYEIRELRSDHAALSGDLSRLATRLEMLESLVSTRPKVAAAAPISKPDAIGDAPVATGDEISKALETDTGKAVIEETVKNEMDRRDRSRWAQRVGLDLDAFVKEAGLTDEQQTKMSNLLGKYQNSVRDLFESMRRGGRPTTEEERTARREEMSVGMETLRTEIVQEAGAILQPAQLASFEEQLTAPTGGGQGRGPGGGRGR
jgi:hypothetical protein